MYGYIKKINLDRKNFVVGINIPNQGKKYLKGFDEGYGVFYGFSDSINNAMSFETSVQAITTAKQLRSLKECDYPLEYYFIQEIAFKESIPASSFDYILNGEK